MVVTHIAASTAAPRARMLATSPLPLVLLSLALSSATGCQSAKPVSNQRLIEHQALIDFSGLGSVQQMGEVRMSASVPRNWTPLKTKNGTLYSHSQWKSPSTCTGVGAVHVKLPLPLSERAILWLAKREYTNKANDGRLIREWTDELGRPWFEAENNKYHVQGYALIRGFNAWIVYFGYKTGHPPDLAELSIAARAAETFVPEADGGSPRSTPAKESVTASAK